MNHMPDKSVSLEGTCFDSRVQALSDWLIDQAFGDPDVVDVFVGLCERLRELGIRIDRANLAWPTLHPLFQAESVTWDPDSSAVLETHAHGTIPSGDWKNSPLRFVVESNMEMLRRRLAGPDTQTDFPILQRLANHGMTDYVLFATRFTIPRDPGDGEKGGVLVSWATKAAGGFTEQEIVTLKRLQRRLAIASKTMVLSRVTRNIAETYLGRIAAHRVLSGQIRRGDGEAIEAVVWYSDLRNSTILSETMPEDEYMALLNRYFECAAGAALAAGGEVLDFIGDAVLAIFPQKDGSTAGAVRNACEAVADADARRSRILADDPGLPLDFGIGIDHGRLMFGNIGVPERLTFSVIGPTVNQVARIEKYTKNMGVLALATPDIANAAPQYWRPVGAHTLVGLSAPVNLYAWGADSR
jgi:adenylate cyclase